MENQVPVSFPKPRDPRIWVTIRSQKRREEEAALRHALKENLEQKPTDEDDGPQREQQKQQFLQVFPQLKKKLEDHIKKLRDLADHLDEVHKGCGISNVVSSSVGTASGILGILGLVLAPFTGGASLLLSATSAGLGATAAVNSVVTNTVEESIKLSDESEASRLVGASMDIFEEILKITPKLTIKFCNSGMELVEAFRTLRDNIRAIRVARNLNSTLQGGRQVEGAFRGTPLAMTRGARIAGAGVTTVFLVWDIYNLVEQSKDLHNGAKTESAGALRDLCEKLQDELQDFEKIYKALQSGMLQ